MTDIPSRLEEIRQRTEAATEGPWDMVEATEGKRAVVGHLPPENVRIADVGDRGTSVEERNADARWIASARSDVPYLLSLVEELLEAAQKAEKNLRLVHEASGPVPDAPKKLVDEGCPSTFGAWKALNDALRDAALQAEGEG